MPVPMPIAMSMRMAMAITMTVMMTAMMRTVMDTMRLCTAKARFRMWQMLELARVLRDIFILTLALVGVMFLETVMDVVLAAMRLWVRVESCLPRFPRVVVLK